MWPFKSSSQALSGFVVCDGKRHVWSSWEQYEQPMIAESRFTGKCYDFIKKRQRRRCEICNFVEDVEVKD